MKISFSTRAKNLGALNPRNGYGVATIGMLESVKRLGYHIEANDPSADVEIAFDQPHFWNFSKGTYKIGYHPWESTELHPEWVEIMNKCDEIWTPSDLIADWYVEYAGITAPVFVYEHGIEHFWTPKQRTVEDKFKFLHIGAEASRKGGWDTVSMFRAAFGSQSDVTLTLKMINSDWNSMSQLGPVTYINEKYEMGQMIDLYHDHHVFVYPSFGEGFGLNPLQAAATGMPSINAHEWAPYRRFLEPSLKLSTKFVDSPWPKVHPGMVLRPSFDDLVDHMRYAYDNYEDLHRAALDRTDDIHREYDWDTVSKPVWAALEKRINS